MKLVALLAFSIGQMSYYCMIELRGECLIGGYTKIGRSSAIYHGTCTSEQEHRADKDVFVFYLKSPDNHKPFISNIKKVLWYSGTIWNIYG